LPITDPTSVATTVVYGTQLTIHSQIETALQALDADTEIFDISIVRKSVGNNFLAVITYEAPPSPP
jgi:hypothetical protein